MADDPSRPPDTDPGENKGTDSGDKAEKQRSQPDAADARKEANLLGLGLQLAVTVGVFVAVGWYADHHWGWTPWGQQGLGFVGIVVGLYFFVKEATK